MKNTTIIGAGPVGLSFALLHASFNEPCTLIDQSEISTAQADPRNLALSYGSVQILTKIGVDFGTLSHCAIGHIHISEHGAWGHTQLHREQHHVPMLGAVVRYGELVTQLNRLATTHPHIEFIRPATVVNVTDDGQLNQISIQHLNAEPKAETLTSALVVHAEGGVFKPNTNQITATTTDYHQTALLADVTLAKPQPAWAWERFTANGPCALLPASHDGVTFNLVWCVPRDQASSLVNATDAVFLAQLNAAMQHLTGKITHVTPRKAYPLGLKQSPPLHSKCRIAIGNAAQTLHPVAGQGFNLGLRDAFVLAQQLKNQPSHAQAIAAFTHARQADRAAVIKITDTLASGFAVFPMLKHARSAGFAMLNSQPWLKQRVAEQFMYGVR